MQHDVSRIATSSDSTTPNPNHGERLVTHAWIKILPPIGRIQLDATINEMSQLTRPLKDSLVQKQLSSSGTRRVVISKGTCSAIYTYAPWVPCKANRKYLPYSIPTGLGVRRPRMRSPDRKPGMADIMRKGSRVKDFTLKEAIRYSYLNDMRFITTLCLMIGYKSCPLMS